MSKAVINRDALGSAAGATQIRTPRQGCYPPVLHNSNPRRCRPHALTRRAEFVAPAQLSLHCTPALGYLPSYNPPKNKPAGFRGPPAQVLANLGLSWGVRLVICVFFALYRSQEGGSSPNCQRTAQPQCLFPFMPLNSTSSATQRPAKLSHCDNKINARLARTELV